MWDVARGLSLAKFASRLGATAAVTADDLSANMLSVTRSTAAGESLTIEWREGNAEQLPFRDAAFDLVLCQFALMFITDKAAALSEMRRVATESGRVLNSVCQGLVRHPFYQTLHHVMQQRLGMSALQEIFAFGNADDLRGLVLEAGFRRVEIKPFSLTARFPNPEAFIAGEIEVDTAAIPSMQHLDSKAREAIVRAITKDMQPPLKKLTSDNHVMMPFHGLMIRALP